MYICLKCAQFLKINAANSLSVATSIEHGVWLHAISTVSFMKFDGYVCIASTFLRFIMRKLRVLQKIQIHMMFLIE